MDSLNDFLTNKEKIEVKKILKTYELRKDGSFIVIIGIDSDDLHKTFNDFLYDEIDNLFEYTNLAGNNTLNEIAHVETINTNNPMIVNTYNSENSEDILNSFQYYRDYINEKNLKIFLFVSKRDFNYLVNHCFDFFSVNSYAFSFTDHSYKYEVVVKNDKLDEAIRRYNDYVKSGKNNLNIIYELISSIGSEAYKVSNLDIALEYLNELLKISIKYHKGSLSIFKKIKSKREIAGALSSIGSIYHLKGELDLSLKYHKEGLGIFRTIGNTKGEVLLLTNIGSTYHTKGDLNNTIKYYKEALKVAKMIKIPSRIKTLEDSIKKIEKIL